MHTIVDLQDALAGVSDILAVAAQVGSIAAALLQCFFGFRLLRFWVAAAGFVIGAYAGFRYLAPLVLSEDRAWYLPLLIALAAGLVLAILSFRLFRMGLFLFAGAVAFVAVRTALESTGLLPEEGWLSIVRVLIPAAAFLLAGWLAVHFFRTAIIVVTAIGGAWTAVHTLSVLVPAWLPEQRMVHLAFAAVAAAGLLVQFLTTKKE